MSTVTVTIDGRDVSVPAGSGLVEAAAEIGVEIPVFCYEPRIGPAVGACRMCLVEIEGVPKLQAACATGVRDGMIVSTVGDKAREAQEAVLEFLLLNHPLDCPVCDKGGECPLQDHAFRWGPGTSRFLEHKRVNDKPIPISPLIALDRERCILCYRCSRFSAEVTEDLQLIARERGASSVIATFEGRPYEGHHTGNVIELCPVGALTSTQYRFQARPWEAPDHPSIAPWDPVGSNVYNTVREGRVVRVLSRRNDAVDTGWIDDRTRFAYAAMYGPARIERPQLRPNRDRPVGNRPVVEQSHELAMEWLHGKLTDAARKAPELWVLSGSETLEVVYAIQQVAAQTGGRVVAAPGASAALPAASARIEDLRSARHVLVIGHADLLDTAPSLDLWIRRAAQNGAFVTTVGVGGTRLDGATAQHMFAGPGELDAVVQRTCASIRANEGDAPLVETGIVVYRDGDLAPESVQALVETFQLPREGSGLLAIPAAPNARGLAALGVESATWDEILGHTGGVVYVGVDPERAVDRSEWGPAVKRAAWVVAIDALPTALHGSADLVIPAAWGGEQEGTLVNLEGRLQRMSVGADTPGEVVAQLRWIAGLARRLGATVQGNAASAFRQLAETSDGRLPVTTHGAIPHDGILGVNGGAAATPIVDEAPQLADGELALYVAPNLFDACEVEHTEAMSFLTREAVLHLNRADAAELGLARGQQATVETADGRTVQVAITTSRRVAPGHARVHAGTPGFPGGRTGWTSARVTGAASAPAHEHAQVAAGTPAIGAGDQLDAPPTERPQDGEG
ncbi:MAG: NADH-quinone oxidoreductase, chain [Thermoleophilia bacterium]|nr:NADH-quinone oxidoreductase, chain [Thermoleophilia bacterium]